MLFRIAAVAGLALLSTTIGALADARSCERIGDKNTAQACLRPIQFDNDDDGVAGCVNQCKLDLEICLGLRSPDESRDRCDQLEDQCENGCYNTGPDAGKEDN